MSKTSLEKQMEKNQQETKQQAEKSRREEKKRMRQEREMNEQAALRQRAASIVNGQECINGFRIMDLNAELTLKYLIGQCQNTRTGYVKFDTSEFPKMICGSVRLELEKLIQYGMLNVRTQWLGGGELNLLPAAFFYEERKMNAMLGKTHGVSNYSENNYYGNTNVISPQSSTVIVGNNNEISLAHEEDDKPDSEPREEKEEMGKAIFISHSTKDKAFTDMLMDFLIGIGVPRGTIFCSSHPGNDVNEKISEEIKRAVGSSKVIFAILSKNYYESIPCQNEAGILWYLDSKLVIPVILPNFTHEEMRGFLNSDYKTRSMGEELDIAYIYDSISCIPGVSLGKGAVLIEESRKLKERYESYLLQQRR